MSKRKSNPWSSKKKVGPPSGIKNEFISKEDRLRYLGTGSCLDVYRILSFKYVQDQEAASMKDTSLYLHQRDILRRITEVKPLVTPDFIWSGTDHSGLPSAAQSRHMRNGATTTAGGVTIFHRMYWGAGHHKDWEPSDNMRDSESLVYAEVIRYLHQDATNLMYVFNPSKEICKLAYKRDCTSILYFPPEFADNDRIFRALRQFPAMITDIKKEIPTEAMWIYCYEKEKQKVLPWMPLHLQTEERWLETVSENLSVLDHFKRKPFARMIPYLAMHEGLEEDSVKN